MSSFFRSEAQNRRRLEHKHAVLSAALGFLQQAAKTAAAAPESSTPAAAVPPVYVSYDGPDVLLHEKDLDTEVSLHGEDTSNGNTASAAAAADVDVDEHAQRLGRALLLCLADYEHGGKIERKLEKKVRKMEEKLRAESGSFEGA